LRFAPHFDAKRSSRLSEEGILTKRILVTGGAGFIGSRLSERLVEEGNSVVCLDDFRTGHLRNIEHLLGSGRFAIARQDVVQPLAFEVDEIYNLACAASPVHYQKDPIGTLRSSVFGAANVLELAKQRGIRVLQASTSEVYGDPIEHPQEESHWGHVNPIGPRACYDEGKRCAEAMFFDYWRVHSVQIKIIRIFNTYGPRMQPGDGRVVSNFICQALRNADITIYGDGTQTRSLCYVEDLVEAMVRMMHTGPEVTGPINTGNPAELTILELAEPGR